MQLDRYEYEADTSFSRFEFNSIGPRGVIKKVVIYQRTNRFINKIPSVNVAFGDWDEKNQRIDDSAVSNNHDRDKILATVASTVLDYLEKHGRCFIFAEGRTPARTRLYQMGINAHRAEIESIFTVLGRRRGEWIPFESDLNFDAFMVFKK